VLFFGEDHGGEAVVGHMDANWACGNSAVTDVLLLFAVWVVGAVFADRIALVLGRTMQSAGGSVTQRGHYVSKTHKVPNTALIYSLSLAGRSACQFRATVRHKDIRSNVITCSSNIESFLKTLKVFLDFEGFLKKRDSKLIKRFKCSKLPYGSYVESFKVNKKVQRFKVTHAA